MSLQAKYFLITMSLATLFVASAVRAERHALIVAARDYPNASMLASLDGAGRDGERIRDELVRGGFKKQNVDLVYDDSQRASHLPTRSNILQRLSERLRHTKPDDTIIVVTTGHGVVLNDVSYFCPVDATDDALQDVEVATRELIAVNDIANLITKCAAAEKLLVVDACRNPTASRSQFVKLLSKPPEGLWLMSSCSSGQYSYVSRDLQDDEPHAVFSYFLCRGLAGEADIVGNNNGETSLFELFSYAYTRAREAAADLGGVQTPELFGGLAPPFTVAKANQLVAVRKFTSSDPELLRQHFASLIAEPGIKYAKSVQARLQADFVERTKGQAANATARLYDEYHKQLGFALGTYLNPALELDPKCRLARLGRAWIYRVSGSYGQALADFQAVDEPFDLYVKGKYESIDAYLSREGDQTLVKVLDEQEAGAQVQSIPLHQTTNAKSEPVATVLAHSKVRVEQVRDSDQWLYVTAVNDEEIEQPGWIHRSKLHWFAEAADIYTPESNVTRQAAGVPPAFSRLDSASRNLNAVATRLDAPAMQIGQVRRSIENAAPFQAISRFNSIAGRFGFGIPNPVGYVTGPIARVESYASIPGNYVRMGAGYVQLPAAYAGQIGGWSGLAQSYQSGGYRAEQVDSERESLIQADRLEPVTPQQLQLDTSPWQDTAPSNTERQDNEPIDS